MPDISNLTSPGAASNPMPAPNPAPAAPAPMAPPSITPAPAPPDTGINPNVPPAPPKGGTPVGTPNPPPHARLLAMIQGLGIGLSSFGTALGTHGREGGAPEVIQQEGAIKQQNIQAQQAAQAAKNAKLQQDLMVANTAEVNGRNWLLLGQLPDLINESHLKVAAETQGLATTEADFRAAHGGMNATEFNNALAGNAPAQSEGTPSFFTTSAQQQLGAATKILGANDLYVQKLQKTLSDPKATPKDLWTATNQVQSQLGLQEKATTAQSQKEAALANSPVAKLSTPEALAQPGAQAAIQAKIDDPTTDPNDVPRLRALLPQAAVAQFNAQTIKEREERNQQIVNQGDPNDAGRLLADRSLTLDELKSRNVTPAFIDQAVTAAQKYDPTFKAPEAAAQARIAASPNNAQFFGNTDSLLVKGGTLDQLATAYKALGNTRIPVITKLDQLRKASVGNGPLAAAYAAQLGVADDYSKVISGGGGSDNARQQALDIMAVNLSPAGQEAAINQIRKTIESQRNGRIGTNPYMKSMYPDPTTREETPGLSGTQSSTNAAQTHKPGDFVTLKNGQQVVIKTINPNGTFTY